MRQTPRGRSGICGLRAGCHLNGYTAVTMSRYPQLKFLQSAARASELPPADVAVVSVGRSNVGKRSALNAVTGRKEFACTSKTPGRVRDTWQPMIGGYLTRRSCLREGIQLNSLKLESIAENRRQCEA